MNLRRIISVVTIGAVILVMGGASTSANSPKAPHFTLRVGLIFPFTGDLSTFGPSLDKAAILGATQLNKALKKDGLSGVSIKIVGSEDDQTQAVAGVEAAKKLVNVDHAQVLVGSMASSVTLAIAQSVTIPDHVVEITPTSSDPSLTHLPGKDHWLWRIYPSDILQGAVLAKAMGKAFGAHATVNVGARDDAFGAALAAEFSKDWKAQGGKVGKTVLYNPNATTFDADAQKLAAGGPKAWMIADFPPTFAKMGPALVRAGRWSPGKTFMTEAMDDNSALNQIGAPATDGLRGTAATTPKGSSATAFEALFKKTYPSVSYTGFEGTAFDSVVLAGLAAVRAGTSNPSRLKNYLQPISAPPGTKFSWRQLPAAIKALRAGKDINYEGAWGSIDWNNLGDPTSAIYIVWLHRNGQISTVQTFVFHGKSK
jgi:branched-chain amino acid transport system substrate-binding protein